MASEFEIRAFIESPMANPVDDVALQGAVEKVQGTRDLLKAISPELTLKDDCRRCRRSEDVHENIKMMCESASIEDMTVNYSRQVERAKVGLAVVEAMKSADESQTKFKDMKGKCERLELEMVQIKRSAAISSSKAEAYSKTMAARCEWMSKEVDTAGARYNGVIGVSQNSPLYTRSVISNYYYMLGKKCNTVVQFNHFVYFYNYLCRHCKVL